MVLLELAHEISDRTVQVYDEANRYAQVPEGPEAERQNQSLRLTLDRLGKSLQEFEQRRARFQNPPPLLQLAQARASHAVAMDVLLGAPGSTEMKLRIVRSQLEPSTIRFQQSTHAAAGAVLQGIKGASQHIDVEVKRAEAMIIAALCVSVLIIGVSCTFIIRAVNKPLNDLTRAMEGVRKGDFTVRLESRRRDELGELAAGFNHMSDSLGELVRQVQESGNVVNTASANLAGVARQQEVSAQETAATTVEIGATAKEISATSQELVRTVKEVAQVAEQTTAMAGNGQGGLLRMQETMVQVMTAAATISGKLTVLNEKAGSISQVVTTIAKVADQTNLLSLNAAIEAEKAGEYGRGFSVVATEIRRLADQTAIASHDIEQTVKEMQTAVSAGVMSVDKFSEEVQRGVEEVNQVGSQFNEIIRQVQALTPRFESVNEGMQMHAAGAQEISTSLTQLGESTQQTVIALRQSTVTLERLNEASTKLRGAISSFRLQESTAGPSLGAGLADLRLRRSSDCPASSSGVAF